MTETNGRAHSIIAKLTNLHRETGKSHQYLIDRFAQERFLYRISTSKHRDRFVLKGGLLLTAITNRFYRATRDIDVRVLTDNDLETIQTLLTDLLTHEVADDGMAFNREHMILTPIRVKSAEQGLRLRMRAHLGKARANIQMDMGFSDTIALPQNDFEYPVLLSEYPIPIIRAYSVESVIAEKLEAIAILDEQTSRYKDYDDVLELSRHKHFHIAHLWLAIKMTFERRGTSFEKLLPALGADRASKREREYQAYRKRDDVHAEAMTFSECLERLRNFVDPLLRYDLDGIVSVWENNQWKTK
ncbi:MAG TPA: nucleotidyl transferase AbiEii/AbiGii toxin family protein [Candidatus Baltobacteraceae bacterium]|nr:nucleotidyl transferase AbiEii/AbiGii toxin family protein [Candidatus Baltobacteraceae bacterium]